MPSFLQEPKCLFRCSGTLIFVMSLLYEEFYGWDVVLSFFCWHHVWHFGSCSYSCVLCVRIGIMMNDSYLVSLKVTKLLRFQIQSDVWPFFDCICSVFWYPMSTMRWQLSIFFKCFFWCSFCIAFCRSKPHPCPIYHSFNIVFRFTLP